MRKKENACCGLTQNWLIHVIRRPARARYYYSSLGIFTLSDPGKCIPTGDRSGSLPPFPLTDHRPRENWREKHRCLTISYSSERYIQISLNCTTRLSINTLFMIIRINAESISNNWLQSILYTFLSISRPSDSLSFSIPVRQHGRIAYIYFSTHALQRVPRGLFAEI